MQYSLCSLDGLVWCSGRWALIRGECGFQVITLSGHLGIVCSVSFTPDGTRVVSGSYDPPLVKIWNAVTGAEVSSFVRFRS